MSIQEVQDFMKRVRALEDRIYDFAAKVHTVDDLMFHDQIQKEFKAFKAQIKREWKSWSD